MTELDTAYKVISELERTSHAQTLTIELLTNKCEELRHQRNQANVRIEVLEKLLDDISASLLQLKNGLDKI